MPRPPRLDATLYVGLQRYFLTLCTADRATHFTVAATVKRVHDQILHSGADFDVAILAYCYMPDHLHLLAEGCRDDADLRAFVHRAKQLSAYDFKQRTGLRLWQSSFHDRILRSDDVTISIARYIIENPVRARLVASPDQYPWLGSDRFTVRELLEAVTWQP